MTSVSHPQGSQPPAFDKAHIEAVRHARNYLVLANQRGFDKAPSVVILAEVVAAYDALAARVAWIVASRGEES